MRAYILGLDVSTTCCGWALLSVDWETDRGLHFSKIIPPKKVSWLRRADHILTAIDTYLLSQVDKPIAAIAMEQLNSFTGAPTTRALAGIGGLVQYHLFKKLGMETIELHTTTVKKTFSGSGAAKKMHMVAAANQRFGLSLRWPPAEKDQRNKEKNDEDIADAIGVAWTLYTESGESLRAALAGDSHAG